MSYTLISRCDRCENATVTEWKFFDEMIEDLYYDRNTKARNMCPSCIIAEKEMKKHLQDYEERKKKEFYANGRPSQ